MKVLVYGLVKNGPDSYLKDGWNVFDFVIVIISIVNLIAEQFKTSSQVTQILEMFKILRVLRSLRILSRNEGLKHCVTGLIYSFPGIINATIVVYLCIFLISCFFVSMLKGKFYNCELPQ